MNNEGTVETHVFPPLPVEPDVQAVVLRSSHPNATKSHTLIKRMNSGQIHVAFNANYAPSHGPESGGQFAVSLDALKEYRDELSKLIRSAEAAQAKKELT